MATTAAKVKPAVMGYLPNDQPPFGKMILLGLQHVITMFPATVLCAMLMGFHVSTVLTITGLGTITALIGSKLSMGKFIPLYYGSSFSYIAAVTAVTHAQFGVPVSDHLLSIVQAGFLATGIINVVVGLLIRLVGGKEAVDVVLPPIVTGSVACTIGIGLGAAALGMASGSSSGIATGSNTWWVVALITLVATICYSVYLQGKGFIGLLPILLGGITGYIIAIPFGLVNLAFTSAVIRAPHITFPVFNDPMTISIIFSVGVMCIATIPESTAHLYQISLYVDHLAEQKGVQKVGLSRYIGLNLMLDGLDDIINGIFGSTAGTNYGENNSLMVITRNYSGPVLIAAGAIAILLGFIGPLADLVTSIPTAVSGGLAIYLYGVIGMQGIALMMSEKVNLFDPRQLAIGAVILIVGIGGNIGYPGGFIPFPILTGIFPSGLPAIATGAVFGILLNLIFVFFKPAVEREAIGEKAATD
ncbi:MAG: xanthine permease [Chloroflexi bacterium]|nr:xanthine permease [Chloroflexota bacterium]